MKGRIHKRIMAALLSAALVAGNVMSLPVTGLVAAAEEAQTEEAILASWTDQTGYERWYYGDGWEYNYSGAANSAVVYDAEMDAVKLTVDYSADIGQSWSQMAACYYDESLNLSGATKLDLDFLYDTTLATGGFSIKIYSNGGMNDYVAVNKDAAEVVSGNISKVHVTVPFAGPVTQTPDLAVCVIGNETNYKGDLWLKDITVSKIQTPAADISVDSTISVNDQTALSASDLNLPSDITLVDKEADADTKAVYAYLKGIGESEYVLFGHQNEIWHKAGSQELSNSDVRDVTGTISGIVGIDALSLVGNEYSAKRYNAEIAAETGEEALPETMAGNITAAAKLTNLQIEEGALITLSAHIPNFSVVEQMADYQEGDPLYTKYDYGNGSFYTLSGDVMNQILPGGQYNEQLNGYLDIIAEYAKQVNGTILFRPWHENTGSWFWWGAAFCDPATYKSVYKYTVEYLRDEKDVHNILYVYGPGSEAANTDAYAVRYPGDEYVDMVGFDMYNSNAPEDNSAWYADFKKELDIVQEFARAHNKLIAVTETGAANDKEEGDNQTALKKQGNTRDWYNKVMEIVSESDASYYLLWANFGKNDGFYTPYVDSVNEDGSLHGHELLDDFISFFNDSRSVFAVNQKDVLAAVDGSGIAAEPAAENAVGYITTPVSGSRMLDPFTAKARVTGNASSVQFVLHGNTDVTLDASADGTYYTAEVTAEAMAQLGESVGTIDLVIDGKVNDTVNAIFNIQPPEEDPYEIDDFENYSGVDSLLTKNWATNKATGNIISISLTKEEGKTFSGEYAMKFTYDETSDGWAGATISKEVDWSDCNALQFYTIPDGNNQKVVVQFTANGVVYEKYLNTYEGYAQDTDHTPLLVTIPFSEFCQRDTAGNPKGGLVDDCANLTSFGLWVNAIGDSAAVVDGRVSGTIYYDKITAVTTDATEPVFKEVKGETDEPEDKPVDKTELKAEVDACKKLKSKDYTKDSWKNFREVLSTSKKVMYDSKATQEEVDTALQNLKNAKDSLVEVE
ncbi:MAG: glycosyl hydrolase [Lachnospiraceae bacterium]|nr:glycosyl hydrolase [Lachnospiraceae bacterium]